MAAKNPPVTKSIPEETDSHNGQLGGLEHTAMGLALETFIFNDQHTGAAPRELRVLFGSDFVSDQFVMLLIGSPQRTARSVTYRGVPMHRIAASTHSLFAARGCVAVFPLMDITAVVLNPTAGSCKDEAAWCAALEAELQTLFTTGDLKNTGLHCAIGTVQRGTPNVQQLYRAVQIVWDHTMDERQPVWSWYSIPWEQRREEMLSHSNGLTLSALERQFMNHVNNRQFFDAVSTLDHITNIRIWETRAPLSHIRSSVFFRLESVLSTCGASIDPNETRTEVYNALELVMHSQTFRQLRSTTYDVFALLDDMLGHQEAKEKKAAKIRTFIDENYANGSLDAALLCSQFKLSEVYLARLFKEAYQLSWLDYVHNVRLNHVRDKLEHTDDKLEVIAESVGFTARTMARLFKAAEGVPPGAYREAVRAHQG